MGAGAGSGAGPYKPDVRLGERSWPFDGVFGPDASQGEVYAASVAPLVRSCLAGYNATVLAYGMTGSGKTHTMGTADATGAAAAVGDAAAARASVLASVPGALSSKLATLPEHRPALLSQGSAAAGAPHSFAGPDTPAKPPQLPGVSSGDGVVPRALADLFAQADALVRGAADAAAAAGVAAGAGGAGAAAAGAGTSGAGGGCDVVSVRIRVSYLEIYNEEVGVRAAAASLHCCARPQTSPAISPGPPSNYVPRRPPLQHTHASLCFFSQLRDLLNPSAAPRELLVREGPKGDISVKGALEMPVASASDCAAVLARGGLQRTTG